MPQPISIISEVESALHGASDAKRADVLRRVTDLFIEEAPKITPDQTELIDGVMGQLIGQIESRALAELSRRLGPIANAPADTIRSLARHDDIEISGPILASSERLTDDDLIEIANTKSNGHLAKISVRARLNEAVTDVLVERGDAEVANELATNFGARFSKMGMTKLVLRADGDDRLAESIGRRNDIPAPLFRQLLAQATEAVHSKLLRSLPADRQETIKQVLADISAQVGPKPVTMMERVKAQRLMEGFSQDTELLKAKTLEFAILNRAAEVNAGLSILSGLPFEQIARLSLASNGFGLMVLCKTLQLDWQGTNLVILASQTVEEQYDELCNQYEALSIASAQRIVRFWQARQKVAKHFQTAS
jgi:hypothetical protein